MELPAISPFSIALTEEGTPQFSREPGEGVHYFLGYDVAASRLIEVRAFEKLQKAVKNAAQKALAPKGPALLETA